MTDIDPSEHTIDGLEEEIETIDDPEELRDIREAETDGQDRSGAIEAIDQRLESIDEDGTDGDDGNGTGSGDRPGLIDIRNHVRANAADLIGRDLDGIIGIRTDDDGWLATIEIVERHSVPDTQDILGRYEIRLDSSGRIEGYRRNQRYRRSDTDSFEESATEVQIE